MNFEIKSRKDEPIFEGDFPSITEAVIAAVKGGVSLRNAKLPYVILNRADLTKTDLSFADLSWADLKGANLTEADLRYSNLSDANLSGADLTGAKMSFANLTTAKLVRANMLLTDARHALLVGADMTGARIGMGTLLHGAVLTRANLDGAIPASVYDVIPTLKNPDAAILAAIESGDQLDMETWHTCETTHCRAGWYIHLAGAVGRMLEAFYGPSLAGAAIYTKAYPGRAVPDFYASTGAALAEIKRSANKT